MKDIEIKSSPDPLLGGCFDSDDERQEAFIELIQTILTYGDVCQESGSVGNSGEFYSEEEAKYAGIELSLSQMALCRAVSKFGQKLEYKEIEIIHPNYSKRKYKQFFWVLNDKVVFSGDPEKTIFPEQYEVRSTTNTSCFPITIELIKTGEQIVCETPSKIPYRRNFKIIKIAD